MDLADEIRHHLDLLTEQKMAEGLAPEEARRAALREFGGVEPMKERWREQRRFVDVENLLRDFRFGLRALRRHPGFSLVAVLTLAVAIGVNSSMGMGRNVVVLCSLEISRMV